MQSSYYGLAARDNGHTYLPATFGFYMEWSDKFTTVLPVDISLLGGMWSPFFGTPGAKDIITFSGFTWDNDKLGKPIQAAFAGFPLLHVRDASLLLPTPRKYSVQSDYSKCSYAADTYFLAPRIIADSWPLTRCLEHGQRNTPATMAPAPRYKVSARRPIVFDIAGKERYTSLNLIVARVRELSPRIEFAYGKELSHPF
jgi:hypothetical protein